MATEPSFMDFIADQAGLGSRLTYRKMFGEYALYLDGKVVALVCDNSVFIKPTRAVRGQHPELPLAPPYPGAKPHPVIDELLEDNRTLQRLLEDTAAILPMPKPRKPRKKKAGMRTRKSRD